MFWFSCWFAINSGECRIKVVVKYSQALSEWHGMMNSHLISWKFSWPLMHVRDILKIIVTVGVNITSYKCMQVWFYSDSWLELNC